MDRRIQFAQTTDGVSIAFYDQGTGVPLVIVPNLGLGHLLSEITLLPERDAFLNGLAQRLRVVRYDARGGGMSQREGVERSFEAFGRDIDAVLNKLGLQSAALFGYQAGALVAMQYAAAYPDRVSHLIMWPWYRMPDDASQAAMAALVRANWDAFTEMFAALAFRGTPGDISHRYAALMREAMTQSDFSHQWLSAYIPPERIEAFNEDLAARIQAPTLVLQPRQHLVDRGLTSLVSSLRHGMLQTVSGDDQFPYLSSAAECAEAIVSFLREAPKPGPDDHRDVTDTGLRIVVAATLGGVPDLATDLTAIAGLRSLVSERVRGLSGSHVWDDGRFVLASFVSSQRALDSAVEIRDAWDRRPAASDLPDVDLRIGVHAGEPQGPDDVHLEGAAAIARTVASHSSRSRILVTNLVRELSAGRSYPFAPAGQIAAPPMDGPLNLYEI